MSQLILLLFLFVLIHPAVLLCLLLASTVLQNSTFPHNFSRPSKLSLVGALGGRNWPDGVVKGVRKVLRLEEAKGRLPISPKNTSTVFLLHLSTGASLVVSFGSRPPPKPPTPLPLPQLSALISPLQILSVFLDCYKFLWRASPSLICLMILLSKIDLRVLIAIVRQEFSSFFFH